MADFSSILQTDGKPTDDVGKYRLYTTATLKMEA